MFYPPKGLCEAEPNGVHLILSILLCLREDVWTFRFSGDNPPFQNLENILFTDGMGWDGMDGISKVFFNFLHIQTFWQIGCALTKYMFKVCQKLSYGFKSLVLSWGWGNTIFELTIFM